MQLRIPVDQDALAVVCRRHQVARLEIFGSHARGNADSESDVDVLISSFPDADLGLDYFAHGLELEHVLGRSVDMIERHVVEDDPDPFFKRNVLRHTETLSAA